MNRRGMLGLLAGAPFGAKAAAGQLKGMAAQQGADVGYAGAQRLGAANLGQALVPKMLHHEAVRTVLGDAKLLEQVTDHLFEQHKNVDQIDPDLMVYKSFSTMAKVTFQRQRNVQSGLKNMTAGYGNDAFSMIQEQIHKLMWGN